MPSPTVTPLVESFHMGGFLVSEANNRRSRDQITILSGQSLLAGAVLGKTLAGGAAVATAFAGNTGNGAMGAIVVSGAAKVGVYKLVVLDPVTNAGAFMLEGPDGVEIATGKVGTAFSAGGLAFTLADGATDFIAGDGFTITVTGTAKFAVFDPTATDGTQVAAGILYGDVNASAADKQGVGVVRSAEVNSSELVWGANVTTAAQKTVALASLNALGIVAR